MHINVQLTMKELICKSNKFSWNNEKIVIIEMLNGRIFFLKISVYIEGIPHVIGTLHISDGNLPPPPLVGGSFDIKI